MNSLMRKLRVQNLEEQNEKRKKKCQSSKIYCYIKG